MTSDHRVSAIIIFLNEEKYLAEAIRSVQAQSFPDWELLLVDDGSTDASAALAQRFALESQGKIRYLQHPGGVNRGMSASRNLGLREARGAYIGFLDGDDVWLPEKLADQVGLFDGTPAAGMIYGRTLLWHEWAPGTEKKDFYVDLGVVPERVYDPPALFELMMRNRSQTPTTCNALMRRSLFDKVGGFEDSFRDMFEDQVFFAKALLATPVYVSGRTWARYRQHPESTYARFDSRKKVPHARIKFLIWLERYLIACGLASDPALAAIRDALNHERRSIRLTRKLHLKFRHWGRRLGLLPPRSP